MLHTSSSPNICPTFLSERSGQAHISQQVTRKRSAEMSPFVSSISRRPESPDSIRSSFHPDEFANYLPHLSAPRRKRSGKTADGGHLSPEWEPLIFSSAVTQFTTRWNHCIALKQSANVHGAIRFTVSTISLSCSQFSSFRLSIKGQKC